MHLIERYALSCGVKISKPFIDMVYCPTPSEKYILIHASTGMESKIYNYWQEVVDLLLLVLPPDIKIAQIGQQNDEDLKKCINLKGATSLRQTAFLINNCECLISGDSFSMHVASGLSKKFVSLFGPTSYKNSGPYWNRDLGKIIQADLQGAKPSFANIENPKTINRIRPEEVANAVAKMLNFNEVKLKTLYIGEEYKQKSIEIILNSSPPQITKSPINIRLDKSKSNINNSHLEFLIQNNICNIVINSSGFIDTLIRNKNTISEIIYDISNYDDQKLIELITKSGIKLSLTTKNKNLLSDLRIKYFDLEIDLENDTYEKCEFDQSCRVKTNKIILDGEKQYLSWAHFDKGLDRNKHCGILDEDNFWKDLKRYYIYK